MTCATINLTGYRHSSREKEPPVEPGSVSFDQIKHLLGVVDGPGDLSTNPKYMEGFGESSLR